MTDEAGHGASANGGGDIRYTVKEILSRIEGKLDVMAQQLALKADVVQLESLRARVEELNVGGTKPALRAEALVTNLAEQVNALQVSGSHNAREALEKADDLEKKVTDLKIKVYAIISGIAILATVLEVLRQGGILH